MRSTASRTVERLTFAATALFAVILVVAAAVLGVAATPTAHAAEWRLEQPPAPPGSPFPVSSLGRPGDLQCWTANRCLLAVEGNGIVQQGLYYYNGNSWRSYSTVCGGSAENTRIAWAGPTEFWTITKPSLPRTGEGKGLCHFKDGQVIGSYSTTEDADDRYLPLDAAACHSPTDCWFGGDGGISQNGNRIGAFRLHWDGVKLTSFYGPQGRGISDLMAFNGDIFESTLLGRRAEDTTHPVDPTPAEGSPLLMNRIAVDAASGGATFKFTPEPFEVGAVAGIPAASAELLALDAGSTRLWAVGGGAVSGFESVAGTPFARGPLAAALTGAQWQEFPTDSFGLLPDERLVDVSALPGTDQAVALVQRHSDRANTTADAKVVRLGPSGVLGVNTAAVAHGTGSKIDCVAANDCWMVTTAGWLYHYSDLQQHPVDNDPAFAGQIAFRPNESVEQSVSDTAPIDDSQLFAPPPAGSDPAEPAAVTKRLPAALRRVRGRLRGRSTLVVSFRVVRTVRVRLIASRGGRTVAASKSRLFRKGSGKISVRLSPDRWPTRLRFAIKERDGAANPEAADPDSISVPQSGVPLADISARTVSCVASGRDRCR